MNWITNFVRPKIRALVGKPDQPERLWDRCANCGQMLFVRDLEANGFVCGHCQHHQRLGAAARLKLLFDDGTGTRIELPASPVDPLKFRDRKRYSDRLREAQAAKAAKAGGPGGDALIVAHGTINGVQTVVAAFDFAFMGGSMGVAVGEGFVAAAKLALMQKAPLVAIPASGGARMQEGILSLMQMPRTTIAVDLVKEAGLPYIVVLTDPTTGGVTASFAMLGDITLAEPGAVIGFAGARVIEETIREQLPDGFQRAEYLQEHGMVDMVVPRPQLRETLGRLLDLLMMPHRVAPAQLPPVDAATAAPAADPTDGAAPAGGGDAVANDAGTGKPTPAAAPVDPPADAASARPDAPSAGDADAARAARTAADAPRLDPPGPDSGRDTGGDRVSDLDFSGAAPKPAE